MTRSRSAPPPIPSTVDASVTVWAPASLSNLGPGFDTLGLCVGALGDRVDAWRSDRPGVHLVPADGGFAVPLEPDRNTAAVAARAVLDRLGADEGVVLRIHKGVVPGSGLGSSASSAVAGAWAVNALHGAPLAKDALVDAALDGEQLASGGRHGDNVMPSLLGGLVLTSAADPAHYRRVPLPRRLPLVILQPEVRVLTREARAMLPTRVPLRDAVRTASSLAFLIDAFRCGDWEEVGRCIEQDRLVEPVRAALVPCYDAVRAAAKGAGALGCALSGSGPAMFALAPSMDAAVALRDAMVAASEAVGVAALGTVTEADPTGVRTLRHD